jgi:uncharacterized protein YneF (UPF0154 family)
MDIILIIIVIPVLGFICVFAGSFIRQVIFKDGETKGSFGNGLKSLIIGLIFFVIIGIAFKGCDKNLDNNPSIDYDGK